MRSWKVNVAAALAIAALSRSAVAEDAVTAGGTRVAGTDLVIVEGEVRVRVSETRAERLALDGATSLRVTGGRVLVTTDGETLFVTAARYDGGRFTFASPRFGEFALERAEVKSLSFEGADKLYARLLGGLVTSGGDVIEPHPPKGSVAVAYVRSTGAETAETFSATLEAEAVRSNWRHTLTARSTFTKTGGARSADLKEALYKVDRFLSERAFAYARVGASDDAVAGIDLRLGAGAGAGYRFLVGPRHELAGEAGYEFQHEDAATEVNNVSFGRVGLAYAFSIDSAKAFTAKAEALLGEDRTRTRWETALTAKLNDRFSVRLGFIVEHDTSPPAGAPETTTRTGAAVVWTF